MYIYIQIYWNLLNPWVPEWSTSLKGHRCQAINLKAAGSNSVVSLDVMCCISRQNTKFKFSQSTQLQLVQAGVGGGGVISTCDGLMSHPDAGGGGGNDSHLLSSTENRDKPSWLGRKISLFSGREPILCMNVTCVSVSVFLHTNFLFLVWCHFGEMHCHMKWKGSCPFYNESTLFTSTLVWT